MCLKIIDSPLVHRAGRTERVRAVAAKKLVSLLEKEGVALDLGAYRERATGASHLVRRHRRGHPTLNL